MVELLSLYSQISSADKKMMTEKVRTFSLPKHEYLLLDGEVQKELFLIKEGVALVCCDREDKQLVLDIAYNNRFCVDMASFSQQQPSECYIQAQSECLVQAISYADLLEVFDSSPQIERAYRILLERIISASNRRCLDLQSLSIQERFYSIIEKKPELFGLLPHKYIASYYNIDPTNFSKLFSQEQNGNKLIFS